MAGSLCHRIERLALGLFASAVAVSSCGDVESAGRPKEAGKEAVQAATPLVRKMMEAPWSVAFQGVRLVTEQWTEHGIPQKLVLRETVTTSGDGRFLIQAQDLVEVPLSMPQAATILLLQEVRQGLSFRYRDFHIRDLDLFFLNYTLVDTGAIQALHGRSCAVLEIQRQPASVSSGGLRRVWVDVATGVILKLEELDGAGAPVSALEYESADFQPDVAGVAWHVPANQEKTYASVAEAQADLGFALVQPKQVQAGFETVSSGSVVDPTSGRAWAKLVLTDGVEPILFLQGGTWQPSAFPTGQTPLGADTSQVLTTGRWTAVEARFHGLHFILMGRASEAVLLDLLESCF